MAKPSPKVTINSEQLETSPVKNGTSTKKGQAKDDGFCKCISNYVAFIIVVFGLTFLYLKLYKYKGHYISVSGSGELSVRHFVNDLNAMMCQDYKLSTRNPSNMYLTTGEARVDKERRNTVERSGQELYPNSIDTDNCFYLLEGSNLKVNACRLHQRSDPQEDQNVDLLIFKGDDAWNEFKRESCFDCAESNTSLALDAYCDDGRESVLTYTVSERDTYYITVVKRSEGYDTFNLDIRAELKMNETLFDTEGSKTICTQTSECLVSLSYDEDVDVVVTFTGDTYITTECKLRVLFCVGIFVIFPACLLSVGFTCCVILVRQERKSRKQNQVDGEGVSEKDKSGLMKNEFPPSYDSMNNV